MTQHVIDISLDAKDGSIIMRVLGYLRAQLPDPTDEQTTAIQNAAEAAFGLMEEWDTVTMLQRPSPEEHAIAILNREANICLLPDLLSRAIAICIPQNERPLYTKTAVPPESADQRIIEACAQGLVSASPSAPSE